MSGLRNIFALTLVLPLLSTVQTLAEERLPNFVVIFIDDMGYADIGPFGAEGYETPNLDRMAEEGRVFTDFYVTQAVCSASRAGLMTGCYNVRVGILGALSHRANHGINADEMTLGRSRQAEGLRHGLLRQVAPGPPSQVPAHQPRLRRVLRPALLERHVAVPSRRPARHGIPTCR